MSDTMLGVARIKKHYPNLSNMEKRVADIMMQNHKQIPSLSTAQLAEMAEVSPATVVRFCRSIGFKGIAEYKMYIDKEQMSPNVGWHTVEEDDSVAVIAQKDFEYSKAAINDTLSVLDTHALERAADAIQKASTVGIYAEGSSGNTARCAFDVFMQIQIPCQMVEDPFLQVQSAANLQPGAVAFSVCNSGAARNAVETMRVAKEHGAKTIAIIGTVNSPMGRLVDIPIYTGMAGHPFFSDTITARICELTVLSALHAALANCMRDQLGDYRERVSDLWQLKRIKK